VWDTREARWDDGFARLAAFAERKRHSRVPDEYRDDDGFPLGHWVGIQRRFRKQGRLSDERARRLEALPGWVWHARKAKWETAYASLHRFVEREGHSRVPEHYQDDDGYRLGGWVRVQRASHRRGLLSKDRAQRLESLPGWSWEKYKEAWDDGYARLRGFIEREGHARVPVAHLEHGYRLGQWAMVQRQAYRKKKLDPERRARLEALPGWTWELRKTGARG
jgi:hypothetical protein